MNTGDTSLITQAGRHTATTHQGEAVRGFPPAPTCEVRLLARPLERCEEARHPRRGGGPLATQRSADARLRRRSDDRSLLPRGDHAALDVVVGHLTDVADEVAAARPGVRVV